MILFKIYGKNKPISLINFYMKKNTILVNNYKIYILFLRIFICFKGHIFVL
jgi:hypothetical protein